MVYVMRVCRQLASRIRTEYIVSFKNKFEILVNLVGFIIWVVEYVNLDCAQKLAENKFKEE